jgi:DNA polymerase-3 subunit alpha
MNLPLVHTHLHTSGSLLDGVGNIKNYIKKAKEHEHPAICCTDHGSAISTYYFFNECKKEGIKPIIGCEFYITTDVNIRVPNKKREIIDRDKHLIVLVKNQKGYENFCKLIHFSYTQGFYFKPRITYDMLWEYKEGLIISSACAGGPVSQLINCEMYDEAEQWFKKFVEEFGKDFYAEIQFNEIYGDKEVRGIDQKEINEHIIKLAKKYNTKLILTGDVHYVDKEDVKLQEILINCMYRKSGKDVETAQNFMHAQHLFYQSSNDFFEFNKKFEYNYDEELIKNVLKIR